MLRSHHLFSIAVLTLTLAVSPATRPSLSSNPINNTLLGMPSEATTKVTNKSDFLLVKPFFIASYNDAAGEPNWVSWVLTKDDTGDAPRKRTFDTDTTLPIGFKRIKTKEYASTGFDRGHMRPHSDRIPKIDRSAPSHVAK
jgi:endonuclease G, mitochondrial